MNEHRCTDCGDVKPLNEFYKWRANRSKFAWYCDTCRRGRTKTGLRKLRERWGGRSATAEAQERDREASRRWKEQNRERNRAREREYRRRKKAEAT